MSSVHFADGFHLQPVTTQSGVPLYSFAEVMDGTMALVLADTYFDRKARMMTEDTKKAVERTDAVTEAFMDSISRFRSVESSFVETSKKAAGNVKDASERLAQGISRIEKAANFERLERYVELLERASAAMGSLAELEKTGKLEKIAQAIR